MLDSTPMTPRTNRRKIALEAAGRCSEDVEVLDGGHGAYGTYSNMILLVRAASGAGSDEDMRGNETSSSPPRILPLQRVQGLHVALPAGWVSTWLRLPRRARKLAVRKTETVSPSSAAGIPT